MAHQHARDIRPLPRAANAPQRKVFLRGLVIDAYIGAYAHEQGAPQKMRIDLEISVVEPTSPAADRLEDVVCYNKLTQGIKEIVAEGHIRLIETLAERIADLALSHPMVLAVSVRIEKPGAIAEAECAGVEVIRSKA
ncbi:MAG: dihydroneopterin aldolase [Parvularculaceae bacterium]